MGSGGWKALLSTSSSLSAQQTDRVDSEKMSRKSSGALRKVDGCVFTSIFYRRGLAALRSTNLAYRRDKFPRKEALAHLRELRFSRKSWDPESIDSMIGRLCVHLFVSLSL
jgi:hypothetical protein